jgi:cytochrome c oxidase subunit 3
VEPAIATVLLVVSSGTLQLAERASAGGRPQRARALVLLTVALGVIFLASQVRTWITDDFGIGTDAYGSMFTTMTGFHAIHVAGGLALMLAMLPAFSSGRPSHGGVVATVYYWHFVDVVWIGVFATLFFVR